MPQPGWDNPDYYFAQEPDAVDMFEFGGMEFGAQTEYRDPIETLPKTPYLFAAQDPAQDAFQFPFQYPAEQPDSAYGAQYAPVDMPENLLQEVYDPLQEIDNLNPAKGRFDPSNTLVENAYDIAESIGEKLGQFESEMPSDAITNSNIFKAIEHVEEKFKETMDSLQQFDLTDAAKEQAQEGFWQLLDQEPDKQAAQGMQDLRQPSDYNALDATAENTSGEIGAQYFTPDQLAQSEEELSHTPFEPTPSDLRGENDFVSGLVAQATAEPNLGELGDQYPSPEEIAQAGTSQVDEAYQTWNDLRLKDEGGIANVAPEEPNANSTIGEMADRESVVMRNNELQGQKGIDVANSEISNGSIPEVTGIDVLPETIDFLDLAAELTL